MCIGSMILGKTPLPPESQSRTARRVARACSHRPRNTPVPAHRPKLVPSACKWAGVCPMKSAVRHPRRCDATSGRRARSRMNYGPPPVSPRWRMIRRGDDRRHCHIGAVPRRAARLCKCPRGAGGEVVLLVVVWPTEAADSYLRERPSDELSPTPAGPLQAAT